MGPIEFIPVGGPPLGDILRTSMGVLSSSAAISFQDVFRVLRGLKGPSITMRWPSKQRSVPFRMLWDRIPGLAWIGQLSQGWIYHSSAAC